MNLIERIKKAVFEKSEPLGNIINGKYVVSERSFEVTSPFSDLERYSSFRISDIDGDAIRSIDTKLDTNYPNLIDRFKIIQNASKYIPSVDSELVSAILLSMNGTTYKELKTSFEIAVEHMWNTAIEKFQDENYNYKIEGNTLVNNNGEVFVSNNQPNSWVLPAGDVASHFYSFMMGFLSGGPVLIKSARTLHHFDLLLADAIIQSGNELGYDISKAINVVNFDYNNSDAMEAFTQFAEEERSLAFGNKDTVKLYGAGVPFCNSSVKVMIGNNISDDDLETVLSQVAIDFTRDSTACDTPRLVFIHKERYEKAKEILRKNVSEISVGGLDKSQVPFFDPEAASHTLENVNRLVHNGQYDLLYPLDTNQINPTMFNHRGEAIQFPPIILESIYGPGGGPFMKTGDPPYGVLILRPVDSMEQAIEEMKNLPIALRTSVYDAKNTQNLMSKVIESKTAIEVIPYSSKIHHIAGPHEGIYTLEHLMEKKG